MHKTYLQYLNFLSDESQYPAARCAKAPGFYMHRTLSAVVESLIKRPEEWNFSLDNLQDAWDTVVGMYLYRKLRKEQLIR